MYQKIFLRWYASQQNLKEKNVKLRGSERIKEIEKELEKIKESCSGIVRLLFETYSEITRL